MSKKIEVKNSGICKNENSVFNYFGWPSVAKLPDGNLAMVASGFRLAHVCPFGKTVICYSKDNGVSWTAPAVIIDTPLDDRDSGIVVYDSGKVMVTSFNNSVDFQREHNNKRPENKHFSLINGYLDSINAKKAESEFLGSTYIISNDGGYTFGEIKRVPVQSIHGPCEMLNHKLLYVGRRFDKGVYGDEIECYVQNDSGEFEYLSTIDRVTGEGVEFLNCEPHSIVLPSGKIIVHIRIQTIGVPSVGNNKNTQKVFSTYQCESYDNAKTFTKPHQIGLESGAPSHLLRHSSGVLIASYGYRSVPYGQRVMFSIDDGETWDCDYILRDDGPSGDLGYPATVELDNGSLLTVYYQKEKGKDNCVIMQSIWKIPEPVLAKKLS
ncbi:MAG TPA: sialidase family protein [Clostridia bacterium]|nr:sialidase family protein [Clostridia bacterium]